MKLRLLLMLFGVGLSLVLVEGALRFGEWTRMKGRLGRTAARARLYQADPDLDWVGRPRARSTASSPGEFRLTVQTNSHGFHDRDYPVARTPGTERILMLGDSFLQALQVPIEESAQELLEESLNRRFRSQGRGPVEVLNAGVAGYGPGHEYLLYRKLAPVWRPDLVIVLLCMGNDVEDESPELAQRVFLSGIERNRFFRVENGRPVLFVAPRPANPSPYAPVGLPSPIRDRPVLFRVHRALASQSRLYGLVSSRLGSIPWIRARLESLGVDQDPRLIPSKYSRKSYDQPYTEALHVVESLLGEMDSEVRRNGGRFGVVLVPELAEVRPDVVVGNGARTPGFVSAFDPDRPARDICEFLASRRIPHRDLWPAMAAESLRTGKLLYFRRDGHLNAAGHQVVARGIEEWLLESGLLDTLVSQTPLQ